MGFFAQAIKAAEMMNTDTLIRNILQVLNKWINYCTKASNYLHHKVRKELQMSGAGIPAALAAAVAVFQNGNLAFITT